MRTVISIVLVLVIFAGCASSSGSLFDQTLEGSSSTGADGDTGRQERGNEREEPDSREILEEPERGLQISSYPSGAVIYINGVRYGTSPLLLDMPGGNYVIRAEKGGFYPDSAAISFSEGGYLEVELELQEITGTLLVETSPVRAEVRSGWQSISPGIETEMRIGRYEIVVEAFGYETVRQEVLIEEDRTTTLSVELQEAPFRIDWFHARRESFDPADPGIYGSVPISIAVSTTGEALFSVYDDAGNRVGESRRITFDQRWHHIRWDGEGQTGPGDYLLELAVPGAEDSRNDEERSLQKVTIDPSIDLRVRSVYSGAAGTLLCPLPGALPAGILQGGLNAYAHGEGAEYLIPGSLAFRFSPRKREELVLSGGLILSSAGDAEPYGSLSWNMPLSSSPNGAAAVALLLRGSYFYSNTRDVLEGSSGLSVSLPLSVKAGPLTAALSPELYAGPDPASESAVTAWVYGKSALLLDLGPLSVGLSNSIRSEPFSEGLAVRWPMASALELVWLLPDRPVSLSAGGILDWDPQRGWYISAGGGVWFLP